LPALSAPCSSRRPRPARPRACLLPAHAILPPRAPGLPALAPAAAVAGGISALTAKAALNARLRWILSPGRDLFVVWDRNWAQEPAPGLRLVPAADQLVLKLRWTATW